MLSGLYLAGGGTTFRNEGDWVAKEKDEKENAGVPAISNVATRSGTDEENEAECMSAPGLTSFAQKWKNNEDDGTFVTAPETLDTEECSMGETIDSDANDVMLSANSKEHRERLATKSDDARVPTELWLDHLIEDGKDLPQVRSWTAAEISADPSRSRLFPRTGS
jgi:hypothetical protein